MSQRTYECFFILDSNKYARDAGGVSGEVNALIENAGGEIQVSRLWNEQRLAYPIDGHRKGTYWLTYFKLDPLKLSEFNRACQLNGNVLRHLCIKIDERLEETLIAHASGERVAVPVEESAADASDTTTEGEEQPVEVAVESADEG